MTNFELLKQDLMKAETPEELDDILQEWRWNHFTCTPGEYCIQDYSCKKCYHMFLMEEVDN